MKLEKPGWLLEKDAEDEKYEVESVEKHYSENAKSKKTAKFYDIKYKDYPNAEKTPKERVFCPILIDAYWKNQKTPAEKRFTRNTQKSAAQVCEPAEETVQIKAPKRSKRLVKNVKKP